MIGEVIGHVCDTFSPDDVELVFLNYIFYPVKMHVEWFVDFLTMADVKIPLAVEFSVYSGVQVGGCGYTSLIKVIWIGQACWVAMKIPPFLDSSAEDIVFLIVMHMMCTGELCIVLLCLSGLLTRMYQATTHEISLGRTS